MSGHAVTAPPVVITSPAVAASPAVILGPLTARNLFDFPRIFRDARKGCWKSRWFRRASVQRSREGAERQREEVGGQGAGRRRRARSRGGSARNSGPVMSPGAAVGGQVANTVSMKFSVASAVSASAKGQSRSRHVAGQRIGRLHFIDDHGPIERGHKAGRIFAGGRE